MSKIFRIFISYSSEDLRIAQQLRKALMLFDVDHIDVFTDATNIRTGANWRDLLVTKLKESDWLIAVHTGEHRFSFSFPGWEVGVFEESIRKKSDNSKVFCLFDTKNAPDLFSEKQNRRISVPADWREGENNYYTDDLKILLDDFVGAYQAIVPEDERDDISIERNKRSAASTITRAFWDCQQDDIREQAFPQHRITIRIEKGSLLANSESGIPNDAALTISSSTNTALGIESRYDSDHNLKCPSWGDLRKLLNNNTDWMDHVNEVISGYLRRETQGLDRISFRTHDNKIYRAILSRVTRYKNGAQEIELELIENYPKIFRGNDKTSRLLIALIFASRFRFAFLECSPDSYTQKLKTKRGIIFTALTRQVKRDIERMEEESAELGLTDPELVVQDFEPEQEQTIRLFFQLWETEKQKLYTALSSFANGDIDESEVRDSFESFRCALSDINHNFIDLALKSYQNAIGNAL